MHYFEKLTDAK